MSFAHWLSNTADAFEEQPATTAAAESLHEFKRGATARVARLRRAVSSSSAYTSRLCGEPVTYRTDTVTDMKRARNLNGEIAVAEFLADEIADGTVCWDVGAYHGHYSALMAALGGTVIAFEPDEDNRVRARLNAALNSQRLTVYPLALSDSDGTAWFGGDRPGEYAIGAGTQQVQTKRGDGIDPAPDVLKIDVEGHEGAVLDGMETHLRTVERIAIEVHDDDDLPALVSALERASLETTEIETTRSQTHLGGYRP